MTEKKTAEKKAPLAPNTGAPDEVAPGCKRMTNQEVKAYLEGLEKTKPRGGTLEGDTIMSMLRAKQELARIQKQKAGMNQREQMLAGQLQALTAVAVHGEDLRRVEADKVADLKAARTKMKSAKKKAAKKSTKKKGAKK